MWHILLCWGVLFLLIQQAERLFLIPEVAAGNPLTANLLVKTLLIGVATDMPVALGGLGIAALFAGFLTSVHILRRGGDQTQSLLAIYRSRLPIVLGIIAAILLIVSTADISYYAYNHRHLDFVFFEYIDETLHALGQDTGSQALEQTGAELDDVGKWIFRIGGFWALTALLILLWLKAFPRLEQSDLWLRRQAYSAMLMALLLVMVATAGLGPISTPWADWWTIESDAYYSLSQNPIVYAQHSLRDAVLSQWIWTPARLPQRMDENEAVTIARMAIGGKRSFPYPEYPFVSTGSEKDSPYFDRPVNIVILFVEGLDRRYLAHTHSLSVPSNRDGASSTSRAIRLTPFLDRLADESLYFSHFFSNGVQTTRGIFSTFCSAFPRQGTAVIKTRATQDYLCVPSLLQKAGYRTEMVVSLDSDLPGLRPFLQQNGIEHYYEEQDFPLHAERLGIGFTDDALLDMLETRLDALQPTRRPFFLAALTSGMHHPFTVPSDHPDVQALQAEPDKYMAALRYFDLKFEHRFSRLRSKGLLKDTMVLILGDHGRHEPVGTTDIERQAGHFMAPLFIWLDDSLRQSRNFRPHTVDQVASQVDLAPTLLAMNGLIPRLAPFVGQDLSCLFSGACLHDNLAYLSSIYDDLIGLAAQDGLWLYSFRRGLSTHADLDLRDQADHPGMEDPKAAAHSRVVTALYLAFNLAIERNTLWSRPMLAGKL